jgi:MFS family permease
MPSMVAPPYISEASPPEVRGTLVGLEEFSIVSGIAVAFWTTYGTRFIQSDWSWRLPFLLQMAPAFALSAGTYFLPFWPRWLMPKDRSEEALQSLWKLRQLPASDPRVKAGTS